MKTRHLLAAIALISGLVIGAQPAVSGAASYDVHPGQSIQAAINAAPSGARIEIAPGTYHENLDISRPVSLDGHHTILVPGGTVNEAPCTSPAQQPTAVTGAAPASVGDLVTGICIHGSVDENFSPTAYLAGVKIDGIASVGWSGDGAFAVATDGLDVRDGEFGSNGGYGIFALHSKHVRYTDSFSHDNGDAGFYIGESPGADVRVEDNVSSHNRGEGLLFRDSLGGKIHDNTFTGNCAGIFLLDTGAPGIGGQVRVYDNTVTANNNACPPGSDSPPISGIGIGILGDTGTQVEHNTVRNNAAGGPSALPSGGLILLDTTGFGGTAPTTTASRRTGCRRTRPSTSSATGPGAGTCSPATGAPYRLRAASVPRPWVTGSRQEVVAIQESDATGDVFAPGAEVEFVMLAVTVFDRMFQLVEGRGFCVQ